MGKNSLFSSQGSFLLAVDADLRREYTVVDLVKAKKEAAGIYDTTYYDFNRDGVVDGNDIIILKKKLLGIAIEEEQSEDSTESE